MEALEARLGYTFRDRRLLEHALMHSSYANENARGATPATSGSSFWAIPCSAWSRRHGSISSIPTCRRGR